MPYVEIKSLEVVDAGSSEPDALSALLKHRPIRNLWHTFNTEPVDRYAPAKTYLCTACQLGFTLMKNCNENNEVRWTVWGDALKRKCPFNREPKLRPKGRMKAMRETE